MTPPAGTRAALCLRRTASVVQVAVFALALAGTSACRSSSPPTPAAALPSLDAPVVLFFGDSITRGQGVSESEAFPAVLQETLKRERLDYRCLNAGVSGDTTETALARVAPYAQARPKVVFVELGANDAFRRINRVQTQRNLSAIVKTFRDAGARVILARTVFPHVEHPAYTLSMGRMIEAVAKEAGAVLVPDLLEGVAGVAALNLEDGIHPNAEGHRHLAETAWPALRAAVLAAGQGSE